MKMKFDLHSSVFAMRHHWPQLPQLVPVLFKFYIQGELKLKKKTIPAPKVNRRVKSHLPTVGIDKSAPYFTR